MKFPKTVYNWTSLTGATIAAIAFFMIVFLFAISFFFDQGGSYLGLIIYIVLPAFMILGLILIPIGMWITSRRQKKSGEEGERKFPIIDLNDMRNRNAAIVFASVTIVLLFLSAVGSYEAFEYTESVQFCGTTCHNVMIPEYTAYQNSPHSRVRCVDCHVGSGVDWYVRSKLSGLRQVYKVTLGEVPKPIKTPIANLRPARETCEQCHWPEKFYPNNLRYEKHYLNDEENTEWDIKLLMKIGSDIRAKGLDEGIHWHINPSVKVEYIATDHERQVIPWVRYTNTATGEIKIFNDEANPFDESMIDSFEVREMDCMDCHNRPSHNYLPPAFFVNQALDAGDVPKDLPWIKNTAVELCAEEYESTEEAMDGIRNGVLELYESDYPEILETRKVDIEKAIAGIQKVFSKNIFPEMKVRWDAYPTNIGHLEFNGCFRCHSDTHISEETGDLIPKDCNLCHTIVAQGPTDDLISAPFGLGLEFMHPDGYDDWKDAFCTDCHTGVNP